jgi:hypothetical protein
LCCKLANILLVNAIVSLETVDSLDSRQSIRHQLNKAGLQQLLQKLNAFGYELLTRQIDRYQELADADSEDMYGDMIQSTSQDPYEIFESLLDNMEGKRAYNFFLDMLRHLSLIPEDEESQ